MMCIYQVLIMQLFEVISKIISFFVYVEKCFSLLINNLRMFIYFNMSSGKRKKKRRNPLSL